MKRIAIPLFLISLLFVGEQLFAAPIDSVRMEYINGKAFIIHQVDDGETLYSISKRYNSSMNSIAEATPSVKKGLHTGMMLRVPYNPQQQTQAAKTQDQKHVVTQGETLYSISRIYNISVVEIMEWNDLLSSDLEIGQELVIKISAPPPPPVEDYVLDGMRIHVVQAGEGLYAIARKYDINVDDLVKWNELESSALNLGQELIVGKVALEGQKEVVIEETKTEVLETKTEVLETVAATAVVATGVDPGSPAAAPPVPMVTQKENGLAASIEGAEDENTYLAMHRDLPIGNLVAVRNEMNNQVVFVRIVGKLPDTGVNEKIIIRLSPAAVKQLRAIDPKFRVEISYLIPE